MIGRMRAESARGFNAIGAWVDFGLATIMASFERMSVSALRPLAPEMAPAEAMVAQAVTWQSGRALAYSMPNPSRGPRLNRSVGWLATLTIAAVAAAAALGARQLLFEDSRGFATGTVMIGSGQAAEAPGLKVEWIRPLAVLDVAKVGAPEPAPVIPTPELVVGAEPVLFAPFEDPSAEDTSLIALLPGAFESRSTVVVAAAEATPAAVRQGPATSPEPPPASPRPDSSSPPALEAFVGIMFEASEVRSLALTAGWPEERVDALVQVAWCESRFKQDVVGPGPLGLMQIMPFWFPLAEVDIAFWSDPVVNLQVALFVYEMDITTGRQPWAAWVCKPTGPG